jgi:hypothetical protein
LDLRAELKDAGLLGVNLQPIDGNDVMTLRSTRISIRRLYWQSLLGLGQWALFQGQAKKE